MPQIDQIAAIYASQLFWLVLVFGLLLLGSYLMLPKIQATVDQRDRRISGDLAAAEAARADADAAEEAYQATLTESRATALTATAAAKAQAATATAARVKAADAQFAVQAAEAETRLHNARNEAVAGIDAVAAEAVQEIVAKVSGLAVDRTAAERAVRAVAA